MYKGQDNVHAGMCMQVCAHRYVHTEKFLLLNPKVTKYCWATGQGYVAMQQLSSIIVRMHGSPIPVC